MRNIIQKKKKVYFSNMKKIIKHFPMTDRLIVIWGYILSLIGIAKMYLSWQYYIEDEARDVICSEKSILSDCCLVPTQQFFSYLKLIFNEMMMRSALY